MAKSKKLRPSACVIFTVLGTALLFAAIGFLMRTHVRAVRTIKPGYSSTAVHKVLGEPTAVIKSIDNLNALLPPTTSYRYRTLNGERIESETIRFQVADWYEHGSSGYLVIYENGAVIRTIWGGT